MVLFGLEFEDSRGHLVPVGLHRVTMTASIAVFDVGSGSLGDQRPQTHVFGFVRQMMELLLDDSQFLP